MLTQDPIGIFDSGIGGLTVAHAVMKLLPHENMVYFGDTAHLPYGDKSTASIQAYAIKICDVLLQNKCKLILIACNSASAAAYELVKEYVGGKAKVFDVIDPVVDHIKDNFSDQKIGLIGTKQTVNANVYKRKVDALNRNIELVSLATPLLVPLIEEGFADSDISRQVLHKYLSDPILKDIEALVLGCTHYPLLKKAIDAFYGKKVTVLDSAEIVARSLKAFLHQHRLLSHSPGGTYRFLVSDYTASFEKSTEMFFQTTASLEKHPLFE